jgi:ligand-binding SRPBCC domain-containing protein
MRIRTFEAEQWLPRPLDEVFTFFSDAANLDALTPSWVNFGIVTPSPIRMHAGALIDYRLRVRGIPIRWRTRITKWDPPHRFVDDQLHGPYRLWHHEHEFEPKDGGTLVRDRVRYAVLFDFLVHRFLVRPDMQKIFAYRQKKLRELFPEREPRCSAHRPPENSAPN